MLTCRIRVVWHGVRRAGREGRARALTPGHSGAAGAALLLAQHVPARVVMEILGHSQIALTMNTYSHVAPEVSREAADRMARALWLDEDQADDDYQAGERNRG